MAGLGLYERMYGRANRPEDLPWHRDDPWPALRSFAESCGGPSRRVLDLGCGTGSTALYLAGKGFAVTGIDFVPRAIEMARQRATSARAELCLMCCDVLRFEAPCEFDAVVDVGCLHSLRVVDRRRYAARLAQWLAPGGDYVLIHMVKRSWLDWRPVGPSRARREQILRLFGGVLEEHAYYEDVRRGVPLPMGPELRFGSFWMKRPRGANRPGASKDGVRPEREGS